jgi:hypothetical protein
MYIYMYVRIHTHTQTHTHIHIHSMDPRVCHRDSRMWNKLRIHKTHEFTKRNTINILQELYYKSFLPTKNSSTELKDVFVDIFLRIL